MEAVSQQHLAATETELIATLVSEQDPATPSAGAKTRRDQPTDTAEPVAGVAVDSPAKRKLLKASAREYQQRQEVAQLALCPVPAPLWGPIFRIARRRYLRRHVLFIGGTRVCVALSLCIFENLAPLRHGTQRARTAPARLLFVNIFNVCVCVCLWRLVEPL